MPTFDPLLGETQRQDGVYKRNVVAQNGLIVHAPVDAIGCGASYCGAAQTEPEVPEGLALPLTGMLMYTAGNLEDSNDVFNQDGTRNEAIVFAACEEGESVLIEYDGDGSPIELPESVEPSSFEGAPTYYEIYCGTIGV